MENRESNLLALRPEILNAKVSKLTSINEQFQNKTIRPIIKLQSGLLVEVFKNYIKKRKNTFYELSIEKRFEFVENAIQKDMKFRNSLKGMIIGQFTIEEYKIYMSDSSSLNKRMMSIVKGHLYDNLQLIENKVA